MSNENNDNGHEKPLVDKEANEKDTKQSNHTKSSDIKVDGFINEMRTKDLDITINRRRFKNPVEILEKLYQVRYDKTLNDEAKTEQVKKIMNDYLR